MSNLSLDLALGAAEFEESLLLATCVHLLVSSMMCIQVAKAALASPLSAWEVSE